MKVLLAGMIDDEWRRELAAAMPEAQWVEGGIDDAEAAVVANPPPGALAGPRRLRLVQSLWAGVERLLADPTLPADVPLARMVDPALATAMGETALWAVLSLHRGFFDYQAKQREARWAPHRQHRADEVNVLLLGQGEMGRAVTQRLAPLGYRLATWHRGVDLAPLQAQADIVVNLLPLTPATRGLLDTRFFAALPAGAALVNLARGGHVVESDLLEALDGGRLRHAVLDVFATEPLPAGHAFWSHPKVTVLPHVAAWTDPRSASRVAAANLRALRDGRPIAYLVDRERGY